VAEPVGFWFIDNVSALMSLVKGRSRVRDLDEISLIIHMVLFSLKCCVFFEYVESAANWSDGISRSGTLDTWHREHGFTAARISMPTEVFLLHTWSLMHVLSFL
jgi:hypothetical protein